MVTHPSIADVRRLADLRAPWCVTVYGDADAWLRENHATPVAMAQIRSAARALAVAGAPPEILERIGDRLEQFAAPSSLAGLVDRRSRSIAIFATENGAEVFACPTATTPWTGVADRFLVGPLLAGALSLVPPVFVLAISENEVRLVDVTAHPAEVIDVPALPEDLRSTIALDLTGDRESLAHLRTSEDPKGRLREYARAVDRAIAPVLAREGALLVVASAEPLAGIFRTATTYPLVAEAGIPGNRDGSTADRLAELAQPVIERERRSVIERHLARFAEQPARGRVLAGLDEVAAATREGAVDSLFVDVDHRVPVPGQAFEGTTVIDRVDEIIREALSSGATIVPVGPEDLPTADPVAAVLRWARVGDRTPAR